ncbi:biopolymer transporter ExbD [Bacteroidales bacterium]|nr:biopolymer transporter ExbD [Bacteroidales bacterium]
MARRNLPEINAGSMADIAFLLLIFFLVATTMDVDTGMLRKLPPMPDPNVEPPEVKERNVFVVLVNSGNQLLVEGELLEVNQLRKKAIEFLENPNDDVNLPEKTVKNIDLLGDVRVTKGIISLQNDRGTNYETYLNVLNELVAAGNEVKERFSDKNFGKPFKELNEDEQAAVRKGAPAMVSEAEPQSIGD